MSDTATRPLMAKDEAVALERLFEVFANSTRLRLLHALTVLNDPCMSDLAEAVDMKPQAVSNQLRRLVDIGILASRRHGNHIHYSLVDDNISKLILHGLSLSDESNNSTQERIS